MGGLGLNLITGPANAGKVALLLRLYLEALPQEPYLIVPNRSDVEAVERELLRLQPALLGGSIVTFDDLFGRIVRRGSDARPVATEAQRALVVRRALAGQSLNGLGRSARFGGFADALLAVVAELESGLLDPTDAEWALVQALAGRSEVTVSIPYEPGRAAFESLRRTMDDLSALADGRIEELPPRHEDVAEPALAHLERALFADTSPSSAPAIDGSIRFFEGAGTR